MGKIRIRFFINTLAGGGAEKVLINLLRSLDPKVYEITLLSVTSGIHSGSIPDYVDHKLIIKRNSAWKRRLIYHMPAGLFHRLFLRGKYDLEVAYLEGFPTKMLATFRTEGSKLAFVHMDVTKDNTFDLLYKRKENCIAQYRAFDKVCFVSEAVQDGFFRKYGKLDHSCVVRNVVDYRQIWEKRSEPTDIHFTTDGLKIAVIGRLEPVKGMDRVINIAAELQKDYAFQILVLGAGKEYENLQRLKAEKAAESVEFLGYCENPYPILAQADLLLCASRYEGYSTVVTEALALGIPVLTTDCAGMEEQLCGGRYGMIVENHTDHLREGFRRFLENRKVCDQYRERILSQQEAVQNRVMEEYDTLFQTEKTYRRA